ncbi:beta-ketoacyl synthase N-terminal-like domain-containing protein [Saccharopolyspora sp. NFXS83]|uniref:beta-ketoacyl synthase N-terminal-like domain-containing protein n=1 Tax=Saccharopolyspora sp. NFXS83 TaxID=2993560 RepID=UPI00224A8C79|nr:beta-ketoacyl synthase N-terminal-like domain-containing protein [Saccharopolyspora sp. NFXS83]MCX2730601.1 beta-ketoacyl synthase N-terminal-like domain-containing protein [Saccharopolyspora sp. NFXS83]
MSPAEHPAVVDGDPIAIVGMGLAVVGASSPAEFWDLLVDGGNQFTEPDPSRWLAANFHDPDRDAPDKGYQQKAGYIRDLTPHPALRAEQESGRTFADSNGLWLRHSLHQALESVRLRDGDRFDYCVGYTPDGSQNLEEAMVLGAVGDALDGELGGELDDEVRGRLRKALHNRYQRGYDDAAELAPHRVVADSCRGILPADTRIHLLDSACSSSLYAIDAGMRKLLAGECDVAVCGGVMSMTASMTVMFSKLGGFSARGEVRSLDADADGTLFGDGAGLVVLKRLSRAIRDNDVVHGTIAGLGLSADGKGKAIYSPLSRQQVQAMRNALAGTGLSPSDVGYIIAHATGTKGGDKAEFLALREFYAGADPIPVAANKSLTGHTAWAAGVVSVIHMLLALRHARIPAQHHFRAAPESFELAGSNLTITSQEQAWAAGSDGAPRVGAVSGFGFGGTNAHLLIREYRPGSPVPAAHRAPSADPVVLVGWSGLLPGAADNEAVARWAAGGGPGSGSFGEHYPAPPLNELFLTPAMVQHLDRAQLIMVDCVRRLDPAVWAACLRHQDRTGVVVGHSGPTRQALVGHLRLYLDDIEATLREADDGAGARRFAERFRKHVGGLAPPTAQHSYPGIMPNIVASRLSNYYDLRGLNLTVDDGEASLLKAFEVAADYLRFGDLDFAVVGAANGNSRPEWTAALDEITPDVAEAGVLEGGFTFVITTARTAQREGLPVLASIEAGASEPAGRGNA